MISEDALDWLENHGVRPMTTSELIDRIDLALQKLTEREAKLQEELRKIVQLREAAGAIKDYLCQPALVEPDFSTLLKEIVKLRELSPAAEATDCLLAELERPHVVSAKQPEAP